MESVRIVLMHNWSSCVAPRFLTEAIAVPMTSSVMTIQIRSFDSYAGIADTSAPAWLAAFFCESSDFAQTSQLAFGVTELSCQESFDKVPGHHRPHDPATETNDVHVIVLDSLPSRNNDH